MRQNPNREASASNKGKKKVVFLVVQASDVKKFVLLDLIGGTALYYALKFPLHSVVIASIGSIVVPMLVRGSLKGFKQYGLRNRIKPTLPG